MAVLYDIHGNLPALEAVLQRIDSLAVDRVVIGGDVAPGPMVSECLDRIRRLDLPVDCITGNGELDVIASRGGRELPHVPEAFREWIRWCGAQLTPDEAHVLASWPMTLTVDAGPVGRVLFCHATPSSARTIFTADTPVELLQPRLDGLGVDLLVCGHTHMQFDRLVGATRVVNAGSVGMPFGARGAHWLLLGDEVEFRQDPYDADAAASRVRATSYPGAEAFADGSILSPHPAAVMRARYEQVALQQ